MTATQHTAHPEGRWTPRTIKHIRHYHRMLETLKGCQEALNEVAAYGSCECDIPNGDQCTFCQCVNMNNEAKKIIEEVEADE